MTFHVNRLPMKCQFLFFLKNNNTNHRMSSGTTWFRALKSNCSAKAREAVSIIRTVDRLPTYWTRSYTLPRYHKSLVVPQGWQCIDILLFYFIVIGEISIYLVKIKVVSITIEMISYHFTSDWYDLYFHSSLWMTSFFFIVSKADNTSTSDFGKPLTSLFLTYTVKCWYAFLFLS